VGGVGRMGGRVGGGIGVGGVLRIFSTFFFLYIYYPILLQLKAYKIENNNSVNHFL